MNKKIIKTQCPFCGTGCGLEVIIDENGNIKVRGDKEHPATKGSVCIKAVHLPKALDVGRVDKVLYRESKKEDFKEIDWDLAYKILKEKLESLSPDEVYFYLSGQLLTEDIYVINKFAKGFIGTNNVDSNSRLCVATAVAAYKLAFGSDGIPGCYDDIDDADCFIFIGSNVAWAHPGLFSRILKRKKEDDVTIVTIDPNCTETAKKSDKWIPIKAGTDVVFLNSVLYVLYENNWIDWEFIKNYTEGFEEAIEEAKKYPPKVAAEICEVDEKDIYYIAELFAKKKKLISFWTMGVNQSTNGTMKALAIINLHLATGRLNDRGCPFSLTGQSNAMGGREVGYLSNGLPGYRDVRNKEDREFIEDFWGIERGKIKDKPGCSITEAIDKILEGEIKFLWIVCTNPAVSMPNLNKFKKALEKDDVFVVVQDAYYTDTMQFANLILPATHWGEEEGVMTGGDRTVTLCRKFREPPKNAKFEWQIFVELAQRMGGEKLFPYKNSREIFDEYKKATKGRLCDISDFEYEDLPKRWGGKHLYKDLKFPTPSGKAIFNPAKYKEPEDVKKEGDFILITGRVRKQWHTMTRTGKVKELLKGEETPYVLMNPEDAKELGINEGDIVTIESERGKIRRVVKFGEIKRRHLFTPFGYGLEFCDSPANLVTTDAIDPFSKEPELKFSKVKVVKG
ncbi:molybdopterin oxidoreductase [Methanocaldococcus sp. FS406-22]|uniref:molybdopterin oxidoreductase family protein n=1 Tax=Methanocaldococcus sp. (strain FS406-22) TaxID=644281 RepID=UPI0001BF436F|nr:nitrate reductase [Methanocaldococcus sp. FS406-22]ADC70087.1 molybdopterin oxidoreductase [Methanocaldococcus sp. FS406-22]